MMVVREEEEEEDYQDKIEQQLAKQDEDDVDMIKNESRKRRQAILEKYRQRQLRQVESSSDGNVNGNTLCPSTSIILLI